MLRLAQLSSLAWRASSRAARGQQPVQPVQHWSSGLRHVRCAMTELAILRGGSWSIGAPPTCIVMFVCCQSALGRPLTGAQQPRRLPGELVRLTWPQQTSSPCPIEGPPKHSSPRGRPGVLGDWQHGETLWLRSPARLTCRTGVPNIAVRSTAEFLVCLLRRASQQPDLWPPSRSRAAHRQLHACHSFTSAHHSPLQTCPNSNALCRSRIKMLAGCSPQHVIRASSKLQII